MSLVNDTFICHHFYLGIGAAHPFDATPVRCCAMMVKKTTFGQEESPRANTCRQVSVLVLLDNPIKESLIVPFTTCPLASRNKQNIERWMILDRCVWLDQQPSPAGNNLIFLGNRYNIEES